jgi:serine/threonine protein kinase
MEDITNFEKIATLGNGMYGTVFKARDRTSGKMYALKHIKGNAFDDADEGFSGEVVREIRVLQRLAAHANIVRFACAVTSRENSVYLAFDLAEKGDLDSELRAMQGPMPVDKAFGYAKQLVSAVAYCHSHGIIHRDIKPANILVTNRGVLKLADFGLARALVSRAAKLENDYAQLQNDKKRSRAEMGSLTPPNQIVTLHYRAFELLLMERTYDFAVDMWSVGCVIAEMINKERPRVFLPGKDEADQFVRTVWACGMPHNRCAWASEARILRVFERAKPDVLKEMGRLAVAHADTYLSRYVKHLSEPRRRLMMGLFEYEPGRRTTAEQALLLL